MGTLDISLERVFAQLTGGNVGLAIAEAETYLAAWPHPQTKEKLDTLKTDYQLMADYWQHGAKDSQMEEQYLRLLQRAYVLCANIAIHRHRAASSYLQGLYSQARQSGRSWSLDAIRQEMEGFVSEVAMLELEPEHMRKEKSLALYKQHQGQMNALFNYILTSHIWTEGIGRGMEDLLLSPTVDTNDQQLLVSAITLSLMNRYDMVKFRLLVNVYQSSQDEEVRQRALVGWVLGLDDHMLHVYPEQRQLVMDLLQSKKACRELTELQMQLIYTLNAEKDTTTIQQEIMPDLLKNSSFRLTQNGIQEVDESSLEDILHPDAAEQRMEKLEASFQRMMDMQKQGSDVYFGGFSQMKRFPFFYDISNWLMPFYLQHPDIAQFVEKLDARHFVEQIMQRGPFCNSDKYSFVMAFQQLIGTLPTNMREMMKRGEAQMAELEPMEQQSPAYIRRIYLMDLYRFFRLFPNRSALCNPFDTTKGEQGMCMFFTSEVFQKRTPLDEYKREVVAMLMKQKLKNTALQLLSTLPQELRDVQFYLWMEQYDKALELEPDNERALVGHARKAFTHGKVEVALGDYDRLLLLHPGKTGYMLNKAVCLVELKEYEEAQRLLFQLNYEHPENLQVSRALAWAMTCDGKLEQAEKLYRELTAQEHPSSDDFLNMAYCLWLEGNITEAAQCFKEHVKQENGNIDLLFNEIPLLMEHGISHTDIMMMKALVLS